MLLIMKKSYVCSNCGATNSKWFGKCPDCGEWNTFEEYEEQPAPKTKTSKSRTKRQIPIGESKAIGLWQIKSKQDIRQKTGIDELDRVLGGGLVKGSVVLLAGEPGIGKSTLLLQIYASFVGGGSVLYISGEESPSQLKLRADRIGADAKEGGGLMVLPLTNINEIIPEIEARGPDVVFVDSIQTIYDDEISSPPGSVSQVKASALAFIELAKSSGTPVIMVGHVNKDGGIAGPKVLEHMVDAVISFEGEKQHAYRIIRAVKNRFGSTNEIGVFEMGSGGLIEVPNPSEALISERPDNVSGSSAVCVMEGTRPIIAEIQALVTGAVFPAPRRLATGLDYNRLNLLLAVLEKRLGLRFGQNDVYANVAGGLELKEPSADLALAAALISSLKDAEIPKDFIAFGEIGLAGECRSSANAEIRINEAKRLGFKKVAAPYKTVSNLKTRPAGIEILPVKSVFELLRLICG